MFTPTPSDRYQSANPAAEIAWEPVKLDLVHGPKGRAVVAWMAARAPLRMQWRVGSRTFKNAEDAKAYAEEITGLNET